MSFDCWQTLLADTAGSAAAAHALRLAGIADVLACAGYPVDARALGAADARAMACLAAIWQAGRDVSSAEQVRIFLTAVDPELPSALPAADRDAVEAAYTGPALTHAPLVVPGAAEAVRRLAAQGVALAVISNTGRTPGRVLRRLLERAGLLPAFRVLTFSDEVGTRKPGAEIFHRTLDAIGCDPAAAVHVGDDPAADVAGARAAGMRALHFLAAGRRPAAEADGAFRDFAELPTLLRHLA